MDLTIAEMFLKFRDTIFQQVANLTEMTLAHDHQIRNLRAEVKHLQEEINNKNTDNQEIVDDLPF